MMLPCEILGEVLSTLMFLDLDTAALVCKAWSLEARRTQDARTPVPRGIYRQQLTQVTQDGMALQFAAPELQQDHEVALAAVMQAGWALQFAGDELKQNRELVMAAVAQAGWALRYAGDELKQDRELVMAAVAQCGGALQFEIKFLFSY